MTIERRTWFLWGSVLTVIVFLTIFLTYFLYQRLYIDEQFEELHQYVEKVAIWYKEEERDVFEHKLSVLTEYTEGRLIFSDNPMELGAAIPLDIVMGDSLFTMEERDRLLRGETIEIVRHHEGVDQQIAGLAYPIKENGHFIAAVFVYVPISSIYTPFLNVLPYLLLFLAGGIAVVLFVRRSMVKHIIKPVQQIQAQAQKLAEGKWNERLNLDLKTDEMKELATSFNHMAIRLEEEDNQRKAFLQNVSHELRTPLSYVKGYSELLLKELTEKNVDRSLLNEYGETIHEEAERMERLMRDIHELARLDDEASVERYPLPLSEILHDAIARVQMMHEEKKMNFTADIDDSLIVIGEEDRFLQIFINILDNAYRYTPENGNIVVSAYPKRKQACIRVEDSGIGIPEKDLPMITERFYRVEKARTRKTGGTGLGLSIVQQLTNRLDGKLNIHSEEGKGTTVTLHFPLWEE